MDRELQYPKTASSEARARPSTKSSIHRKTHKPTVVQQIPLSDAHVRETLYPYTIGIIGKSTQGVACGCRDRRFFGSPEALLMSTAVPQSDMVYCVDAILLSADRSPPRPGPYMMCCSELFYDKALGLGEPGQGPETPTDCSPVDLANSSKPSKPSIVSSWAQSGICRLAQLHTPSPLSKQQAISTAA